jgi:hypothetical protein
LKSEKSILLDLSEANRAFLPARQRQAPVTVVVPASQDQKFIPTPFVRCAGLITFGRRDLVLYDWRAEQRKEVPLRVPCASGSAYSMSWSPDGKRLACHVDSYPASIIAYETTTWKPLVQWRCGEIMADSKFGFDRDGTLLRLRDNGLSGLSVTKLERVGD